MREHTEIRPQDVPGLRQDLVEWYRGPVARQDFMARDGGTDQSAARAAGVFADRAESADLFFVSSGMVDLARVSARTLPPVPLAPEDLPSRSGLVVFEEPLAVSNPEGVDRHTIGFLWYARDTDVVLSEYCDRGPIADRYGDNIRAAYASLVPSCDSEWAFGDWTADDFDRERVEAGFAPVAGPLRSAWLLMQQPLAETSEAAYTRMETKRLRRRGIEPPPVRVIELRRPRGSSSGSGQPREWHHKWLVRGHWRQQWYPSRQVHRPVWVAPYVKGPEDAPLLGGEKVYAWTK